MTKVLWISACVCAALVALPASAGATSGTPIPGQYIVVLKNGANGKGVAAEHARSASARVLHTYDAALHGYAAHLTDSGLARVKADPRVDFVKQDAHGYPLGAQTMPTGVNRIDADLRIASQLATTGSSTVAGDVAVYDTGIDTNHPDLNVAGGINCLGKLTTYNDGTINDGFGHGTHIAGSIGAKDDGNGVVGIAPGVRVWAVRVNDRLGGSSTSAQLCGVNWVTQNGPALGIKVVNASQTLFGSTGDDGNCGYTNNDVLHQAICASTNAGITWVFAAMNSGKPISGGGATYDEVLTVTAMADSNGQPNVGSTTKFTCKSAISSNSKSTTEIDDKVASFSNYATLAADQNHTIAAPGMCIWSTFKGQTYGYMNGTSMATPHAAAVVHLCIVSGQCAGTPAETIQKVRGDAAAHNVANPGFGFSGDPLRPVTGRYYGHLVNANLY
jgi:subtilisin family serine protease